MEYNEYQDEVEYMPEYSSSIVKTNYIKTGKPCNALDYLQFQSEEYVKYKLEQKIKERINGLICIGEKYEKEIVEMSYFYYKQMKGKIRSSDIISIVAYKVIEKNNLPIPINEVIDKIGLDKGRYLKYEKLFGVDNVNLEEKKVNSLDFQYTPSYPSQFESKVFHFFNFLINQLMEVHKYKPNAFKMETEKINIDNFIQNFDKNLKNSKNSQFLDILKLLEESKQEGKELIFNRNSHSESLNNFFGNRILPESLAAGIVKYLMDKRGVRIKLQTFRENFKISCSGISKATKMIEDYIKLL